MVDEAHVILVGPVHNHHVQSAAKAFAGHFCSPHDAPVRFRNITLERFIEVFRQCDRPEYAAALRTRYTDFRRLDAELDGFISRSKPARSVGANNRIPGSDRRVPNSTRPSQLSD
jgi:hypothetical protein